MEFKGTQGIWKQTRGGHIISGKNIVCQLFDKKELDFNDYETNNANAKLIASAPELLEALKESNKDLIVLHGNIYQELKKGNTQWEGVDEILYQRIESNKQAIKKATEL